MQAATTPHCWSCYKYAAGAVTDLLLELLSKLLAAAYRFAGVHPAACAELPLCLLHYAGPLLLAACAGPSACCLCRTLCLLHYAGAPLLVACAGPSACCTMPDPFCLLPVLDCDEDNNSEVFL
ncbi:hypothetical protein SLEP1_g58079 [Rubroshorea leprosula]|uniref:Uncharacterized protein n=1 Tax=Rubroshorea leprosula TaxID=152421 RepID=A0AAV5MPE1_9ROSI|nr:hypothetical protein SLEP1_g58079 [Rubroshorea leprosula]